MFSLQNKYKTNGFRSCMREIKSELGCTPEFLNKVKDCLDEIIFDKETIICPSDFEDAIIILKIFLTHTTDQEQLTETIFNHDFFSACRCQKRITNKDLKWETDTDTDTDTDTNSDTESESEIDAKQIESYREGVIYRNIPELYHLVISPPEKNNLNQIEDQKEK